MIVLYRLFSQLPFAVLYGFAYILYLIAYYVVRYRRKVVRKNLSHAFPELEPAELGKIEKGFYRNFSNMLLEVVKAYTMPVEELEKRFTFDNYEELQQYLDKQQSVLLLGVHQGNWEWMIQAISNRACCPVDGVYKPLHGENGDKIFYHTRSRFGMRLVAFDDAMRRVIKGRKEFRIFSMMADQAPISREKRYWKTFLNRPAPFYYGPQLIAELTQYPVVYAKVHRRKKGHYHVQFQTIAAPPHQRSSVEILDNYICAIEEAIREQPDSFLWSNKKWRSPKAGELDQQATELAEKALKAKR